MRLIELVFPDSAAAETRARTHNICELLGKTAIEVPDVPGFVVNRLLFPYLFSAVELMIETGLSPEDIDRCVTLGTGAPMGPFALLDFVGLDETGSPGCGLGGPAAAETAPGLVQPVDGSRHHVARDESVFTPHRRNRQSSLAAVGRGPESRGKRASANDGISSRGADPRLDPHGTVAKITASAAPP